MIGGFPKLPLAIDYEGRAIDDDLVTEVQSWVNRLGHLQREPLSHGERVRVSEAFLEMNAVREHIKARFR